MSSNSINTKVVVLCMNSCGEPEFHTCSLDVTHAQSADGVYYTLAKENAAINGYCDPMIAFDNSDCAAKQLGDVYTWL